MKPLLAFLLVPAAMAGYFVAAIGFGIPQRYPLVAFAVMLAGLVVLGLLLREKFTWGRAVLNAAGWGLALLFAWWTLVYSTYRDGADPPGEGERVAAATLTGPDGEPAALAGVLSESPATLLVFYRGPW